MSSQRGSFQHNTAAVSDSMLEIIQRQQQIINTQLFHIVRHLKKKTHEQRFAVNALLTVEQFNGILNI